MKAFRKLQENAGKFYPQAIAASLIVATVLIVYWQDLWILFGEALHSEAASHVLLVPFLAAYLFYRKREHVRSVLEIENKRARAKPVSVHNIIGVAACLTAFLLFWYGSSTFYPLEYHVASLVVFIIGILLILTNLKVLRILIFPIMFLLFLTPPPSIILYTGGGLLASVNTQGSYALLRTAGLPVSLSYGFGAPILALETPTGPVEFAVYQASSGLYSLIAFAVFATFVVYISVGSLARKGALLALGLAVLPILNIARISIIVAVAYWLGQEIAMNVFHTFTGWFLIFGGILLLLVVGEKLLKLQIPGRKKENVTCTECRDNSEKQDLYCLNCGRLLGTRRSTVSKISILKIIAILICSSLVAISFQAPAFAFTPGLVVENPGSEMTTSIFPNITGYRVQFLYRDSRYERVAGQDASLIYAYVAENSSALPIYVLVGVSTSISSLHNWEVSLVAWRISQGLPPLASIMDSGDTQLTESPRIIARYLVFQYVNQTANVEFNYTYVALYWYQRALFNTGVTIEPRYVRINLLMLTSSDDVTTLIDKLQVLGQLIVNHWEPLKERSLVSLAIPVQQFLLASSMIFVVSAQASQYTVKLQKRRTHLRIFEKFAPQDERLLYQSVLELSRKRKITTTQNIASTFLPASGKAVRTVELLDMLKSLEKQGILRLDVASVEDQPRLVWKP